MEANSGVCDGSGGNGGDGTGVVGRLVVLVPFVGGRTRRGGTGEPGWDVGAGEGEMLLMCG